MSTLDRRYDRRVVADFAVAVTGGGIRRVRRAQNISYGGLQIRRGLEELELGDELNMRFRLPDGHGPIRCGGEVVYEEDDRVGIRFTNLPLSQQVALDRFLTDRIGDGWFM